MFFSSDFNEVERSGTATFGTLAITNGCCFLLGSDLGELDDIVFMP